ncbi:hypothetical protein HFN_1532 [Helicobacter fennelliae MRY12-0050]|uniref:Uncharacterized protein n=1 Tax=Helicobacter fennelliae MRY12-0050 TaxID=1325130 RepID=T1DUL4_9HELI|nr:hypothetical protein HFN_1532 [Helicobacter fennelliae MRY12-0050]
MFDISFAFLLSLSLVSYVGLGFLEKIFFLSCGDFCNTFC